MSASTSSDLSAVIEQLRNGATPTDRILAILSDLPRDEARQLRSRWLEIPEANRAAVMVLAASLADEHVELDFQRLAVIGLDDPATAVQVAALFCLDGRNPRDVIPRLATLLGSAHDAVRLGAAQAADPYVLDAELGNLPPHTGDELAAAIERALANPAETVDVRAALLATAGPIEAPWVSERIRDAFYSDDRELRHAAVVAMGRSANIDWFEFLEESLLSEDHELRRSAAEAFGAIGDEAAVDLLADMLDDEDIDVVGAAVSALGEIGGPDALAHLNAFQPRVPPELEDQLAAATESADPEIRHVDIDPGTAE